MLDGTHPHSLMPRGEAEQEEENIRLVAVGQLIPGPLEEERQQDQDGFRVAAVGLVTPGPLEDDNQQRSDVTDAEMPPEWSVMEDHTWQDARLDVRFSDMGFTEVDGRVKGNLAALCALYLTPDKLEGEDHEWKVTQNEMQAFLTPRWPRVAVLGCGTGGTLLAVASSLHVVCVIQPGWTKFECIPANSGVGGAQAYCGNLSPPRHAGEPLMKHGQIPSGQYTSQGRSPGCGRYYRSGSRRFLFILCLIAQW